MAKMIAEKFSGFVITVC